MSRKIDLDKKLSEEDVRYLVERDQWASLAYNVSNFGTEIPEAARKSFTARGYSFDKGSAVSEDEKGPEEPPAVAPVQPVAPSDPAEPAAAGPAKFSEQWFDKATVAELQEELTARELPKTGKRDDLADRLWAYMVEKGEIKDENES